MTYLEGKLWEADPGSQVGQGSIEEGDETNNGDKVGGHRGHHCDGGYGAVRGRLHHVSGRPREQEAKVGLWLVDFWWLFFSI